MNGPQQTSGAAETPQGYRELPPETGRIRNRNPGLIPASDPRLKSPLVASVLSAVPGLGQIYVGYYPQGFMHAILVAGIITVLGTTQETNLTPFLGLFLTFFWLFNIIDAGRRASFYNQALSGESDLKLPDTMNMPGFGGSIFGGVLFIVAGGILLLHNVADMPMDWVEDWWPVLPIAFGGFLIYRAMQDREERGKRAGS